MICGIYTALITPFLKTGEIDEHAFAEIVREQLKNGVDGLVINGTTGESPTIEQQEFDFLVRRAVNINAGKKIIIAGTGSNSTKKTIEMTKRAKALGADAALVVSPYYNKPSQNGLLNHFHSVAKSADFPILLYDVPGRTGVKISPEVIIQLANTKNIIGIKMATGTLADTQELVGKVPEDFALLSGDDALILANKKVGGHGVISVASHFKTREIREMLTAVENGNMEAAEKMESALAPFIDACFCESNPVPIKTMMAMAGKCEEVFRAPMGPLSEKNREHIRGIMTEILAFLK